MNIKGKIQELEQRLNPENGICQSALYDRAFNNGLIDTNVNYEIILSIKLKKNADKEYFATCFAPIENVKLQMPQKYYPNQKFLEWHLDCVFEK